MGRKTVRSIVVLLLLAIMACSLLPLSYLLRNDNFNRENITGFYAEKKNSLELVYVGGSAAFVYWEPLRAWKQAGISSYVLGQDTIPPQSLKYYLIESQKTQRPDLYVVDLRPFQYGGALDEEADTSTGSEAAIRNGTDNFSYSANRIDMIDASVPEWDRRLTYYFDLLNNNSRWPYILYKLIAGVRSSDLSWFDYADNVRENGDKGFYFVIDQRDVALNDYSNVTDEMPLQEGVEKVFVDLLEYAKEQNLRVLFTVHVYEQQAEDKMKYNYMERRIREYGFDFINMNDYAGEIGIDSKADFYNSNHVNIFGADKYTDFLTTYVTEHYDLKDLRGNPDYQEWFVQADSFEAKAEQARTEIRELMLQPRDEEEDEDWWLDIP